MTRCSVEARRKLLPFAKNLFKKYGKKFLDAPTKIGLQKLLPQK